MVANDRNRVLNLTWRRRWIRRFCDFAGAPDPIESELAPLLRNLLDHRPPTLAARTLAPSTMNSPIDVLISIRVSSGASRARPRLVSASVRVGSLCRRIICWKVLAWSPSNLDREANNV